MGYDAPKRPRLLFCSYHSYLDPSSGAALSTGDLLALLARAGWQCAVLTGPGLYFERGASLEAILRAERTPFEFRPGTVLDTPCTLYPCALSGVAFHAYVPTDLTPRQPPTKAEGQAFLSLLEPSGSGSGPTSCSRAAATGSPTRSCGGRSRRGCPVREQHQ